VEKNPVRLQIGCGNDLKPGWINHDLVKLPGVDVVHDLNELPWPWGDKTIDEIWAGDVLEHLPNTIVVMEELYRITKPGARVYISVPYWNSWEFITDPTHVRQFNEFTFEFFDPTKEAYKIRPYYSKARFIIEKIGFGVQVPRRYIHTEKRWFWKFPGGLFPFKYTIFFHPLPKWIFGFLANFFSGVITGLEIYLIRDE
jgi:SAM-dependent methyltransferase